MKVRILGAAALAACALFARQSAAQTVQVAQGQLQGAHIGTVEAFLGIPFAAPPVGQDRWTASKPPAAWSGIRDATHFGASCAQALTGTFGPFTHEYVADGPVSEDCLFANVWTPTHAAKKPAPVLVFIHGGAFLGGSGAVPIYNGAELAKRGVVVVTINYRLGVFGFLAHPELTKEAGASGNYGLMDMVAALRWVHDNIAAFGGDPSQVTIAGQSAGSAGVHDLIASPLARGLFVRAIAESGSGVSGPMQSLKSGEDVGVKFAARLGVASIADLRAMPAEALLKANGSDPTRADFRFGPIVDGRVLPKDPATQGAGEFNDTPVLTGLNADEGSAMPHYGEATPATFSAMLGRRLGSLAPDAAPLYPAATDAEASRSAKQLGRDAGAASLYMWATDRAIKSRQPLYAYYFSHTEPGAGSNVFGAFHTAEVPYVFETFSASPERGFTHEDYRIGDLMADYWVNFIRTGDPNGKGLAPWPAFDPNRPAAMELGDRFAPTPVVTSEKLDLFKKSAEQGGGRLGLF